MSIKNRGFASMTPEKRRAAQSKGGKSANQKGKAYKWDSVEASLAGVKGGRASAAKRAAAKGAVSVPSDLVPETDGGAGLRDDRERSEDRPSDSVRSAEAS